MLENKRRSLSCVCFLTLVMFVSFKDNNVGDATCTTKYIEKKKKEYEKDRRKNNNK